MGFIFEWHDEAKTILRYTAGESWNWNDYHKAVRMSLFALHKHPNPVHVLIDLRQTRQMPSGAVSHIRTFGKKQHPNLTGRAVVIGLDPETEKRLTNERLLRVDEQEIHFVDTEDEALKLLTC